MSFVFAEKNNNTLNIHCDTKIGLDDSSIPLYSCEQKEAIEKYGIVKTTIICPEISISFAGNNIHLASKLFVQLSEKKTFTTEEVIDLAYDIHTSGCDDDIEFIIASCEDDSLSIHCIKNNTITRDCQFAWIGSSVAHREFQELRNRNNIGNASDRTTSAFLNVVQGCSDESVGGFHIMAGYDSTRKTMCYRECITFQSSKEQTVKAGDAINFFMEAENGGFSVEQLPISIEDLILRFGQTDISILYSRRLRISAYDLNNPKLFSFMLPMLIKEDGEGGWIRK